MKIGILTSLWLNTPPEGYGGTEEVIYELINGLVDSGHDVTVFGPTTVKTKAKLVTTIESPIIAQGLGWTNNANIHHHLMQITKALDMANEFDILHMPLNKSHDYIALPLALNSETPVVFTLHFSIDAIKQHKERMAVLNKYRHMPYISISNSQRAGQDWNFVSTVYNGLNISHFPFSSKTENYFAWLGKVNRVKGTREAIFAAKKAGEKLLLMGAVDKEAPDMYAYYQEEIEPLIDNKQIVWLGEADMKMKADVLSKAEAMLNPISWEEPFGMVMAESQAVGTPVIAFNRGAAPELIENGKTGFLVDNIDEMVAKMKVVSNLNRVDARKNVEEHFTVKSMVSGYENAYKKVIENWDIYRKQQEVDIKRDIS